MDPLLYATRGTRKLFPLVGFMSLNTISYLFKRIIELRSLSTTISHFGVCGIFSLAALVLEVSTLYFMFQTA